MPPVGPRASMMWLSATALAFVPLACAPGPAPEVEVLELRSRFPKNPVGVRLNEDLQLFFNRELDRSTVTASSVRVLGPNGRRAEGQWRVEGRELRFVPEPVFRADLSDGGFRPGTSYTVELRGFPDPGGVRAEDGAPLRSTLRWSFTTVESDEVLLFEDATLERGSALKLSRVDLSAEGDRRSILLRCGEPLDPRTLFDDDFSLVLQRSRADVNGAGAEARERVRVRASLRDTPHDFRSSPDLLADPGGVGWVELVPVARLMPGETYWLDVSPTLRLRDYGGNPIWYSPPAAPNDTIKVNRGLGTATRRPGSHRESFLDSVLRSPVVPPAPAEAAWDGTAHWGRTGRVGIVFPAAAGNGAQGEVVLDGQREDDARQDLQATTLTIAGEETLGSPGMVVLRAQGRLHVTGKLTRTLPDGAPPAPSMKDSFDGGTLSDWLARAVRDDRPWLALIAGGDLILEGGFEFDTPILCVAGGVVRITGRGRMSPAHRNELWVLGDGGVGQGGELTVERADLVIDQPATNPLAAPLRFAVMSGPLPRRGKVLRWYAGRAEGHAGSGAFRVRYLSDGAPLEGGLLVDDPRLLGDAEAIRFVVELSMGPGVAWDPPFVDEVELTWEEPRR